ncbi:MAG: cell fate regulator YaaT (PSP1 superfamily) [Mariniblastus sp.]|jgi:cell fate regulator YaaT (PSP1 superfamily)
MSAAHLVRVGLMGVVGRFDSADFNFYPRDSSVICRTRRGLESGVVICPVESDNEKMSAQVIEGQILRRVGSEDQMILERLERHRDKAFNACQKLIVERGVPGVLVDVEHLFDGESVFFYFLGDPDPRLESITAELASTYERKVRFKKFAETLANGCGPDCGTGDSKCSTGGCGTCALSGGCGAKSR